MDYQRDGFSLHRQVIPAALVGRLIACVARIQAGIGGLPPHLRRRLTLERDISATARDGFSATGDAIFIIGDPAAFDPVFASLARIPAIVGPAVEALGTTALITHFCNVTIKHPRFGRRINWHRDFPNQYVSPPTPRFLRLMICLDGMDPESGATAFVPGSHLGLGDSAAPRTVSCGPGDMVLIHPEVLHGSEMNRSDRWRRNVIFQVGTADAPPTQTPDDESLFGTAFG
jgi:hypothetical protein